MESLAIEVGVGGTVIRTRGTGSQYAIQSAHADCVDCRLWCLLAAMAKQGRNKKKSGNNSLGGLCVGRVVVGCLRSA